LPGIIGQVGRNITPVETRNFLITDYILNKFSMHVTMYFYYPA
jgi:hypothetical protein